MSGRVDVDALTLENRIQALERDVELLRRHRDDTEGALLRAQADVLRRDERVRELEAALAPLIGQAQYILDVLASGSEPSAPTGYGYEHMGDYTRDVQPLCEALVALGDGA